MKSGERKIASEFNCGFCGHMSAELWVELHNGGKKMDGQMFLFTHLRHRHSAKGVSVVVQEVSFMSF